MKKQVILFFLTFSTVYSGFRETYSNIKKTYLKPHTIPAKAVSSVGAILGSSLSVLFLKKALAYHKRANKEHESTKKRSHIIRRGIYATLALLSAAGGTASAIFFLSKLHDDFLMGPNGLRRNLLLATLKKLDTTAYQKAIENQNLDGSHLMKNNYRSLIPEITDLSSSARAKRRIFYRARYHIMLDTLRRMHFVRDARTSQARAWLNALISRMPEKVAYAKHIQPLEKSI